MGEHLKEYVQCLEEDGELREFVKSNPHQAMAEARLSHDEKQVLLSGDPERIAREVGLELSPQVRDAIVDASRHL